MACKKILRKHRQVCIGALDTEIVVNSRTITEPIEDSVDYTETFVEDALVFAAVETTSRGQIVFDGTNTARVLTHRFYIRFLTGITAETWVESDGINYDILNTETLDGRNEFILLNATRRGSDILPINEQ